MSKKNNKNKLGVILLLLSMLTTQLAAEDELRRVVVYPTGGIHYNYDMFNSDSVKLAATGDSCPLGCELENCDCSYERLLAHIVKEYTELTNKYEILDYPHSFTQALQEVRDNADQSGFNRLLNMNIPEEEKAQYRDLFTTKRLKCWHDDPNPNCIWYCGEKYIPYNEFEMVCVIIQRINNSGLSLSFKDLVSSDDFHNLSKSYQNLVLKFLGDDADIADARIGYMEKAPINLFNDSLLTGHIKSGVLPVTSSADGDNRENIEVKGFTGGNTIFPFGKPDEEVVIIGIPDKNTGTVVEYFFTSTNTN